MLENVDWFCDMDGICSEYLPPGNQKYYSYKPFLRTPPIPTFNPFPYKLPTFKMPKVENPIQPDKTEYEKGYDKGFEDGSNT